jgi:prepilin signal peptidase PulO-like enzyme (type II secretory pathway)
MNEAVDTRAYLATESDAPDAPMEEQEPPTPEEIRLVWQQPIVLVPAVMLAVLTLTVLGPSAHGIIGACFVAILVVLAAIDIEYRVIPNRIVLPAAAIVLVAQLAFYPGDGLEWVAASLGAALFLFIPLLIVPSGMGLGDVKLALLIGAMLGLDVIPALFIGFLSLWPVGLYLIATQGWSARKAKVPLGPSLAFGAIVVLLLSG